MQLIPWLVLMAACTPDLLESDLEVHPGVETATVLGAEPGQALTLYGADGTALFTVLADDLGQAHFAYVPTEYAVYDSSDPSSFSFSQGQTLAPGAGYEIRDDSVDPPLTSGSFSVLAVDDVPWDTLYEEQELSGVTYSLLTGFDGDPEEGFQYITMRDGVSLSAMVRFPDPLLYGEGPWPTVIEYSGYSPSRPDKMDGGTAIANALGYATVSVNMRGTGCSGGVYDVFNPAQHADGYDVVETVARQEWVLNGQVGMVGLSYPGISQLYVASTNPPSLAAVIPLSVIGDAWEMQWPGGIYNEGFTKQWVAQREADAAIGGSSWVGQRIEAGDAVCEENVRLSSQNIDFGTFLHGLPDRPTHADDRDLNLLVQQVEAPVFLGGAWQDEQTGAQFGAFVDRFESTDDLRVVLYNGRHPDGYGPDMVVRWHEHLELYVAERVPRLNPALRSVGATEFAGLFDYEDYDFPDDRWEAYEDSDYAEVLEAYRAEPEVAVLFESGTGSSTPGAPTAAWEVSYDRWPVDGATEVRFYPDESGLLAQEQPSTEGADAWSFDPEAGNSTFFGPSGYELFPALWDIDWTRFQEGYVASYTTAPLTEDVVLGGPGIAELWVRSPEVDEVQVQLTLTEVRPDGTEYLVQSGWLDLAHRAAVEGADLRLQRTYAAAERAAVPVDEWVLASVQIPSFVHPFRAGSALRVAVSTPGRNHGTWEFEAPEYSGEPSFHLGRGGEHASAIRLITVPGVEIPTDYPACPSLRGQPCREDVPVANVSVE